MRDTQKYFSLPFNPALKERAKSLRKAGNLAEVLFWQQVKNKNFLGLDFDRQKIIAVSYTHLTLPTKRIV